MKKMLVLGALLMTIFTGLTGCGSKTRPSEYWSWNDKFGEYELVLTDEKDPSGDIKVRFGEVKIETTYPN